MRDSKNPTGPALVFTATEWVAFTAGPHGLMDACAPSAGKKASSSTASVGWPPTTRSPRTSGPGFGVATHGAALAALGRRPSRGCSR
ncbi:MAG: DUF397 domain-containing protein [Pseudonocardiaceae bacterium]